MCHCSQDVRLPFIFMNMGIVVMLAKTHMVTGTRVANNMENGDLVIFIWAISVMLVLIQQEKALPHSKQIFGALGVRQIKTFSTKPSLYTVVWMILRHNQLATQVRGLDVG